MRRAWGFTVLLAVVLGLAPVTEAHAADGCTTGAPEAWFVGIVYDEELRDDFKADVANFEIFRDHLGNQYCIPATQATILAFEDGAEDGFDHPAGTEANLKAELARVRGAIQPGETFFFFLSSHGNAWSGAAGGACPPDRLVGSFAALGAGDDPAPDAGLFDDCELGAELAGFPSGVEQFIAVDCSFCGGFSDSLTAVSGTIPDGSTPTSSGVPGPGRVVVTGCAVTTECFGSTDGGGNFYESLQAAMPTATCDGWTAPNFPELQGIDLPQRGAIDGTCTSSEWFFAAVQHAYESVLSPDGLQSVQQQFRIKYGLDGLADDIPIG